MAEPLDIDWILEFPKITTARNEAALLEKLAEKDAKAVAEGREGTAQYRHERHAFEASRRVWIDQMTTLMNSTLEFSQAAHEAARWRMAECTAEVLRGKSISSIFKNIVRATN